MPTAADSPALVAVVAAATLLAALGLAACGNSAAKAATVLHDPRAVSLQLADGTQRSVTDGMTVPEGATVRTALGGSASLRTAGRTLLLGQATAVTVVNGEREQLRAGLVMVDARRAPGLTLDAGAAVVHSPRGTLARIERGALLRVGSFRKTVSVRAAGRRASADVDALHQVQVPDGGLPGSVTPLALTNDSWERRYALDLVTADRDLTALADGLDASGTAATVLRALPAVYSSTAPIATGEPRSEAALAYVVAEAARARGDALRRYATVRSLREDGGSWGVVAALVRADVAAVSAALDGLLAPIDGQPALAAGGDATVAPGTVFGGPTGPGTTSPDTSPGTPGSTTKPSPRPSPSPSGDPVQAVVDTVSDLLPTPVPTPPVLQAPTVPSPSPSPLLSVTLPGVGLSVG